ncbi:MAG: flagellin, partial [Rhodanobacter sp.]
ASSILLRMKDLATQAADDSSTTDDRTALQSEYDALGAELANIMANTSYGSQKLLDKTDGKLAKAMTFQIGASSAEKLTVNYSVKITQADTDITAASKSYGGAAGDELTTGGASANGMIDKINNALKTVGGLRSDIGATQNRLEHISNNLANMAGNTTDAEGRIMDVDYASESANMLAKQVLMQASSSMLKQSSSMGQMVLSLLQ